jgi:signal transduction protein with GAF and PtsI domain
MTISTRDVHRALKELGSLRFGATDVDAAMHEIVRTTHRIFGVDGAGLMLTDAEQHLRNAAVSDDRLAHLEELQIDHHEGPCIDSFEDKELVQSEDLAAEGRWPLFGPAALDRGLRAVLASPIPYNRQAVGVVAVVSATARPWTPEGELALVAFTDLAALLIATVLHDEQQSELATQLQGALDARVAIEQAKGVLIARDGLSPREAFNRLRADARAQRRRLTEVASDVVLGARAGAR